MKVSEYIVEYLEDIGVTDIFYVSGGMIMWLVDSLYKSKKIRLIHMLSEQSAVIAADGYAQYTGKIGVVLVTSGPGATNAITGVAASYIDSTPLLVISGQCKTADIKDSSLRSNGVQEVDIMSIVHKITKHSASFKTPHLIKGYLDKFIKEATTGRKGPVWLEIPLDIQRETVLSLEEYALVSLIDPIGHPLPFVSSKEMNDNFTKIKDSYND